MGTPVGSGMDENKAVELSNGTVMLNSRASDGTKFRKVALSYDGGATYTAPRIETQLVDPHNNGAITRAYPDAAQGSAQAKILLFTNAASQTTRALGRVRYSCDDGLTWSAGRVFQTNYMSYSTITALGNDKYGLLYEGPNGKIIFATIDKDYIGISC
jgi:sialidase-1